MKNETHPVDIDDNTIFGTLVTHAEKAFDTNDEIFRVINLLVQKQNQVIPSKIKQIKKSKTYKNFSCC